MDSEGRSDIPQTKRKGGVSQVLELSETEIKNVLRAFYSDEEFGVEDYELEGEEEGSQASEGGPVSSTLVTAEVPFSPLAVSNPLDSAIAHSSSAAIEPRRIVWNAAHPSIPRIPFVGIPGLRKIPISQTPRGYFDLLFSDELYELVLGETEKFAEQLYLDSPYEKSRITVWKILEKCEFQVWLGLLFHIVHIQINLLESYWRTDPLYSIPIFAEKMSRDRFLLIMQALHFAENPLENQQEPANRLFKIRPLINIFHKIMRDVEYPHKNLSLYESMVLWQGRLIF
ncbi:hypothetical protein J437_LFUL006237 [Ladona fulva]|uniref:PiggyBac transposable element-derived protein domain-containing protein n=1 Tax=Ladona fulva TaxID=123851 RepID=A0A8K0K6R4_LADFU|nr:hypothetical protein J437_LFUL006237 [Ladona fulva]